MGLLEMKHAEFLEMKDTDFEKDLEIFFRDWIRASVREATTDHEVKAVFVRAFKLVRRLGQVIDDEVRRLLRAADKVKTES